MTNAETITKLNGALSTLIKAYEELQEDNSSLKNRIDELENEVLELEQIKEDLEKNVNEIETNVQEDNSNISSMLGKIESLLNKKVSSASSSTVKEEINIEEKPSSETKSLYDDVNKEESKKDNDREEDNGSSNKIDLNRMASLLNGFNH
jgi:chromosome segregation ATPase